MTTNLDQILEVIESAQVQADRNHLDRAAFTAQIAQAMAMQQIAGALTKIESHLATLAGTVREYEGDAMFRVCHYD